MVGMAPTTTWTRLHRRLGLDHNPLRRRSDLIEAWLLPGFVAALLILGPVVGIVAGHWASAQNAAAWQAQRSWHSVPAVLTQSAPGPAFPDGGANSWTVWIPARWTAGGRAHAGNVPAPSDTRAGSTVRVWLDQAGQVREPLTVSAADVHDLTTAGISLTALVLLLAGAILVTRRVLDRRRLAGWATGWMSVGPQWSGQR
jgi:hypothetical protein